MEQTPPQPKLVPGKGREQKTKCEKDFFIVLLPYLQKGRSPFLPCIMTGRDGLASSRVG